MDLIHEQMGCEYPTKQEYFQCKKHNKLLLNITELTSIKSTISSAVW